MKQVKHLSDNNLSPVCDTCAQNFTETIDGVKHYPVFIFALGKVRVASFRDHL